jgi:DNA polymerase-3 subunit alpha
VREFLSPNQYFKTFDDIFDELDEIFSTDSRVFDDLIKNSVKNLIHVSSECDFRIDTGTFRLPEYRLTEEQSKNFEDKHELFWYLIEKGLREKVSEDKIEEYRERVDREYAIVSMGDRLEDYFLILWDIIDWCHQNDILVGVGRGSSGGCLIAYLLDIVKTDPIEYDLLFERFLNENRVKKSLPDIDSDFEGLRRDDIKEYMEQRFGKLNVCSVGTYANIKMKMAIFDLSKMNNVDVGTARMMTSIMSDLDNDGTDWSDLFRLCTTSSKLKTFVKKNSNIVNDSRLILMQPRSASVHACATIITPEEKTIFEWFPIRKMQNKSGDEILVSEWEGFYLDKAGFLKEDILGILQLDKFAYIRRLVRDNTGEDIDIYKIDKDDRRTFEYFHNGWNEDIFQFGTRGLKSFSKEVRPDSIEELTAMNALYRPGAMKSNAHNDYVSIKFGKKDPEYDYMLRDVTESTYGLYLYQEQTMLAAQKLGGMSLTDADMMRKVMLGRGKKQQADKFYIYMNKFIEGAEKNGCDSEEAERIWEKLEAFAGYGFNRSHAVAYALTGYIGQYLKVHYPIEFWTCAFSFVSSGKKDEKIPAYISEIHQTGDIKMLPPDINKSGDGFSPDFKTNSIYWSLNSVKQCGDKAVEQLVNDKAENGDYFSFAEFLSRNVKKGSKVTKQVIEHLVMSGAFDEIENITHSKERYALIESYREDYKIKVDKTKDIFSLNEDRVGFNWWWNLQQKTLCGFALFDFRLMCEEYMDTSNTYMDPISIAEQESVGQYIKTGGYINEIRVKSTKKGEYAEVILDNNFEFSTIKFWQDGWSAAKRLIENKEKSILLISGKVIYDNYKKMNVLNVNDNSEITVLD